MMSEKPNFKRFLKYSGVGISTFTLDLLLLYIFTDIFLWNYIVATGVAFAVAISINYFFSRHFVFKGTLTSARVSYFGFMAIALIGISFAMVTMYALVEIFQIQYLISRVMVAGIVGMWNYLMNLYVNFKVAGK